MSLLDPADEHTAAARHRASNESRALPLPESEKIHGTARMRQSAITVFIGVCVSVVSMVLPASVANAYTLTSATAIASAYYRTSNQIYNGSLDADAGSNGCWQMERKTSTGEWVTSGFHLGSQTGNEYLIQNCGVSLTPTQWHIVNPSAVFGLRFYKPLTGDVRTFCSDQLTCYALR